MKISNIKYLALSALTASSLFMGCSEEFYEGTYKPSLESHYLHVVPRDFEFGNGEETQIGSVESDNAWSFTSVPAWLSLSPLSGNSTSEFSITSRPNESVLYREAVFSVSTNNTSSKIQRTLTASQTGSSPYITFPEYSSSTITIEGKSDYLIIDVSSNIPDLTAVFSQSWASASYNAESKTVKVEIQANETNSSRNGTLTVSSSQYSTTAYLTISQLASGVTILEGIAMNYEADGGSQTRTIKSDLPWIAKTTYSWIDFSPESGNAGETTMTITTLPSYESDKRIGQVYFYFGETEKKYIGITQAGRYISLSEKSITLSSDEGSEAKVSIESNIEWEVSSSPDWLIINNMQGNAGNTVITITAAKNNSLNSRSGTIIISDSKTGGIQSKLSVKQNGLDLGDNTTLEFSWHQSSLVLDIPLPREWSAAVSDGWISLSDYAGNGNKTITVSVSKNDAEDLRTGKISFTSEGKTIEVTVIQTGQYIKLDNTSGEFSALGGSLSLTVAASVKTSWAIEYSNPDDKWVHVDKISEEEYSITVDYNPSSLNRTASFILSPTDDDVSDNYVQGVKCTIKQIGRKLTTDKSKIIMFARGGTSDVVFITCDGSYSIEKDPNDSWYTLVPNYDNNSFYLVVTENTLSMDRNGHVNIMLKDLPQGEEKTLQIEVLQHQPMTNIGFDPYDEDENWNL